MKTSVALALWGREVEEASQGCRLPLVILGGEGNGKNKNPTPRERHHG